MIRNRNFVPRLYRKKCKQQARAKKKYDIVLGTDYRELREPANKMRSGYLMDLNGALIMHTLNKMKELDLKRRLAEGKKKIRVAFLVDALAKFSSKNIYEAMLENDLFEPFVVLYNLHDAKFHIKEYWQIYVDELASLRRRGFRVCGGYDDQKNFIPLETFKPDIVFVCAFYLDATHSSLSGIFLNANFLVCQINYGFHAANSYHYHYNNRQINSAWKYFADTREDYNELLRYSYHFGLNAVYAGSPKIDSYAKPADTALLPAKLDFTRKTVIYAPHWNINSSVNVHDLATFHLYHAFFLEFATRDPDINFIFKPHPGLGNRLAKLGIMTLQEYNGYMSRWNSLPNGLVCLDDNYLDIFRASDLLITDSGSFIFEWLPTLKPCLYLRNPGKDRKSWFASFSPLARKALKTYYICKDIPEIENAFAKVLLDQEDPKQESRKDLANKIFDRMGQASISIVNYLQETLCG